MLEPAIDRYKQDARRPRHVLNALMTDDIEVFILRWRLKMGSNGFKVRVPGPGSASRSRRASLAKLTLTQGVGRVYEVQLMLNIRTLDQLAKPCTLQLGVAGEIEHDRNTLRQKSANVWRERVLQSRRALNESRNVGDLARKQGIQEIVLHKKDSIFPNGQISCESGLACRHLPAEKHQLR